jgi:hypothetical protein
VPAACGITPPHTSIDGAPPWRLLEVCQWFVRMAGHSPPGLERVRSALRRSEYRLAIDSAARLDLDALTDPELAEVAEAARWAVERLPDDS